jgi:hypothetical protein
MRAAITTPVSVHGRRASQGGNVIGSSDADGMEPKDRPVQVCDIHAASATRS